MKNRLVRSLKKIVRKIIEACFILFWAVAFFGCGWIGMMSFAPEVSEYTQHLTAHHTAITTLIDEEKYRASCDCDLLIEASSYTPFKAYANGELVPVEPLGLVRDVGPATARQPNVTIYVMSKTAYTGPYEFVQEEGALIKVEVWGAGKIAIDISESEKDIKHFQTENKWGSGIIAAFFGAIGLCFGAFMDFLVFGTMDLKKEQLNVSIEQAST